MARGTLSVQIGLSPDERQVVNDARNLETLTYTLLGEARGEGVRGMVGVANVIRNRTTSGVYPRNPVDVVLQPWQFSTNNPGEGGNQAATRREVPAGSPLYRQAEQIVREYVLADGIDLTGGSLFYHVDGLDWRYADAVRGPYGTEVIGNHVFYPRRPVPLADIGDDDFLAGIPEPAPMPRPRADRPGGYSNATVTRAMSSIDQMREEMAIQRLIAAHKATPPITAGEAGVGVASYTTPELTDTGIVDNRPTFDARFDPARGAFVTNDQFIDEWLPSSPRGPAAPVLGLGSLIGRSFPMTPPAAATATTIAGRPDAPTGALPAARRETTVAGRPESPVGSMPAARPDPVVTGRPDAPIGGMPASAEPPAIASGGAGVDRILDRPVYQPGTVQVVSNEPRLPTQQQMNALFDGSAGIGAATGTVRVVEQETPLITRKVQTIRIDPYTLQPIIENEESRSNPLPVVPLPPLKRVTDAQRAVAVGPVPLPRSARPSSATAGTVPIPKPPITRAPSLAQQTNVQPLSVPVRAGSSASKPIQASATQTINPALRNAITSVKPISTPSQVKSPAAVGIPPKIVTQTITVRQSGEVYTTPQAGSVAMPAGARPAAVPLPSAATVTKQLAPPTQTIDPAMRNAMTALAPGQPTSVPPVPLQRPVAPPPVVQPVAAPMPVGPVAPAPVAPRVVTRQVVVRRVVAPPPPPQVQGASGRSYTVGGIYTASGNAYRVEADGSYTKVGRDPRYEGMSSAATYDAINSDARKAAAKRAGVGTTSSGASKTTSTGESWAANFGSS